jgi:DNA-binding NarL/FixJ family response regulator
MIRVLIANDHVIIRKGLKQILMEEPPMFAVGEAGNGQEVFDKLKTKRWDVIVLDVSLPDRSVLEVLKRIKVDHPRLPVVVFAMDAGEHYAMRVLRAGASGYLTRDTEPDQLITAIQKVARGERYVSPSFAEKLAFNMVTDSDRPPHELLSDREFQILCMIASGQTITEIAAQLYLSVKTVSTHRSRILEKMKMKNNAELIIYSIRTGLMNGAQPSLESSGKQAVGQV